MESSDEVTYTTLSNASTSANYIYGCLAMQISSYTYVARAQISQMITIIFRVVSDEAYLVPPTFNWMISPIPGVKLLPFVAMMTGPAGYCTGNTLFRDSCYCHESQLANTPLPSSADVPTPQPHNLSLVPPSIKQPLYTTNADGFAIIKPLHSGRRETGVFF